MFERTMHLKQPKRHRIGRILAAFALLSLLAGCVVYVPEGPHYHYWR